MNYYVRVSSTSIRCYLLFCILSASKCFCQSNCTEPRQITEFINGNHLQAQKTDDAFSDRVFEVFLSSLDPEWLLLNKVDSIKLAVHQRKIDDYINSDDCLFLADVAKIYRSKIILYQNFCDSVLKQPLSYLKSSTVEHTFFESKKLAIDYRSQKNRFIVDLKYKILSRAWRIADGKNEELSPTNFSIYEKLSRDQIKIRTKRSLDNLLNPDGGFENSIKSLFLKSIALSYDPHTEFFSSTEMKEYEIALSTSDLSFGFELIETQTGEIQIERLSPGGPAWRSEVIKEGDALISLKFNNGPVMDAFDYDAEEILDKLVDTKSQLLELTVKKPDGALKTITLKKEKTENTENLISSVILEKSKKVGYISLPGFYRKDTDQGGRGCDEDVAKEIIKLKKDGIEGLILDLRFNGGGSVQEAVDLTGIFIDAGPVAVIEERDKLYTLKDSNKGSIFSGPLIILINAFSASASELVSAALQDYNRAIILGTKSYGKATGQVVQPMTIHQDTLGFVKITQDRIYRITGSSIQLNGVVPDISFPEISESLTEKEQSQLFALKPKSISKKLYYTTETPLPITKLKTLSDNRISESVYFQSVVKLKRLIEQPIPLEISGFISYMKNLESSLESLSLLDEPTNYKVYNSKSNASVLAVDSYHREINLNALNQIKRSAYISEAYDILIDQLSSAKP